MEAARLRRQLLHAAEQSYPGALRAQLGRLVADDLLQQHEEAADLLVGAGPVLAAEGVEREHLDAAPDGVADDLPDRLDAGGVAVHLGLAARLGPAPIAVHDDRDVARQLFLGTTKGSVGAASGDPTSSRRRARVPIPVNQRRGVGRAGYPAGH